MNRIEPIAVPPAVVTGLAAWLERGTFPPAESAVDLDGVLVDLVAVRQALTGRLNGRLPRPELAVAVLVGTAAGYGSERLGLLLGVSDRTIVRWRGRLGCKGVQCVRT